MKTLGSKRDLTQENIVITKDGSSQIRFAILALTSLLLILPEATSFCDKKELVVGGNETSWTIPPSNNTFKEWAKKIDEFVVGDTLSSLVLIKALSY
ncbi:hypothetical protein Pint_14386 [Pistacia integerrima]|uniref:Uncharacterized protein n=1 Tax=Pistacia integerrima TaxID=434235 RepID=A0ACC0Y922_9ROSI|nr:hypothetical protein Pint_14386 [Pistacia integerrima]